MPSRSPSASRAASTKAGSCVPGYRSWIGSRRGEQLLAATSLFDRVVSALFGQADVKDEAERQLIDDMIEMIVDTVEPRVRLRTSYQEKLKACVRATIACLRSIGKTPLEPVLLTR